MLKNKQNRHCDNFWSVHCDLQEIRSFPRIYLAALQCNECGLKLPLSIFLCHWDGKYSTGWQPPIGGGVDQKRGPRGQNIPNRTWFFAKCPCLGGLGERLFFWLHFHFFWGSGRPFSVGCCVFQKLWFISQNCGSTEVLEEIIIPHNRALENL